jgi:hypothetical protein
MSGVASSSLAAGPGAARGLLDAPGLGVVALPRPSLDDLPYREFVRQLLQRQGFKLDFNGQAPDAVIAMVADQLLGPGTFARERAQLAGDIAALTDHMQGLAGGPPPMVSIRTFFAPGDLVWHVDRLHDPEAFRLVWPIGRPAGMRVTPRDNIDARIHRAYMRREHPLLCRLDTRVARTGAEVETLWAHRPAQLAAMVSGEFPFVIDPALEWEIAPGAASIHRVETPEHPGTWHRSSWRNRRAPGLQIVITAASYE